MKTKTKTKTKTKKLSRPERYANLSNKCMKEMFKRVGLKFPNEEFTSQPEWYLKKEWTIEEQNDFAKWMRDLLAAEKDLGFTKKTIDWEVGMFLLNFGWKTKRI